MQKISTIQAKEYSLTRRPFTRRDFLSTSMKAGAAAFTTGLLPKRKVNAQGQYNVLFITVDDLRPLLGCYGHSEIHTPNIDRIAERGTLFNRAYCQYPLCSPSRISMITGLRPETTGVLDNRTDFRQKLPNVVTLPQHFKEYGYHTQSVGKIAHNLGMQDDTHSWSVPSWTQSSLFDRSTIPAWQALNVEDDELSDGKIAKRAVNVLKEIQNTQFFLAVGFHKPHLPFNVPKKYYELYNSENFNLPSPSNLSSGVPAIANPKLGNIREFQDIPDRDPLSDAKILKLIWAYAASVSYMDAQVGRVLDQLDALRLLESLLNSVIPEKTVLLPNYPNPFNPETWMPYDLAQDAEVHIHIHNLKGESIHQLSLGFQTAGTYRTPSRAAYWDGRNSAGELVASGIYFYTLHAGQSKTTRQMVILK